MAYSTIMDKSLGTNRPFARFGHMVQERKLHGGTFKTKQNNSHQSTLTLLCFGSTMWPDRAKGLFALLTLLHIRQARIQLYLPTSPPHPHPYTMLKTTTCNFFWFSTLYWVGRGNSSPFLKGKQRFFQTSVTKQLPHSHKCTEAKNDWFGGLH